MAVDADNGLRAIGDVGQDVADQRPELLGNGVSHRVRDVDGTRSRGNGGLDHLIEVLGIRARRVHGREFDVLAAGARLLHRGNGHLENLITALAQLALQMYFRSPNEGVDACPGCALQSLRGPLDIMGKGPGQSADHGALHFPGNAPHRLEILLG